MVVCGNNDGPVRAWRAHDGKPLWEVKTGDKVRYGAAFDEKRRLAVFGGEDGLLYIVDDRGKVKHTFTMAYGMYSTPLVHDGIAYAASLDKNVYAVNLETGKEVWRYKTNARVFSTPALVKGRVVVGNNGGRLYVLDAKTGQLLAQHLVTERITNKIAYDEANDRVYLPTFANEIYCLIEKPSK